MTKLTTLEKINSNIELAKKAIENASKSSKVFVVLSNDNIFSFHKSKRGAESKIKKYDKSYYDEYSMTMVNSSSAMTIEEITILDIVDYSIDKNIWFQTMFSRWKINQSNDYILTFAKQLEVSQEIIELIEMVLQESDKNSFPCFKEKVEIKEEVEIKFNDDKNEIELYFNSKPEKETILNLKENGFRWSNYNKCWYSKKNEKSLKFIELINNKIILKNEIKKDLKLEEIELVEFVDINTFKIEESIEKNLINNSLFSGKKFIGQENEYLRHILNEIKNDTLVILDLLNYNYEKNKYIKGFNNFCKKYHAQLSNYLYNKSINPSWAVTGRGNLNMNTYNKKMDNLNNKMIKVVDLLDSKKKYLKNQLYKIKKEIKFNELLKIKNEINSLNLESINFKVSKKSFEYYGHTYTNRCYSSENYFTMNIAGCYRIFDNKGSEIHSMKTKDTLTDTKLYIIYLENII